MAGIDVNQHNLSGTYPLIMAVSHGDADLVKVVLDSGGDVNIVNHPGETPLTQAISRGLEDMVQLLLDYGANVNQICKGSTTFYREKKRGKICNLLFAYKKETTCVVLYFESMNPKNN